MKNPLGYFAGPIILVFVLGFVCSSLIQPIQSYQSDESSREAPSEIEKVSAQEVSALNNDPATSDAQVSSNQQEPQQASKDEEDIEAVDVAEPGTTRTEDTIIKDKRAMGMPASQEASTSDNPEATLSSGPINDPVNDPKVLTLPLTDELGVSEGSSSPQSTARGMGGSQASSSNNNNNGNSQQQVRTEDLPKIIEKNNPVYPQQSQQQDPNKQQLPGQQVGTELVKGSGSPTNGDSTMPLSSARTFDGWTNCVGAQSNKYGTCKNDIECGKSKGRADGSCMGGLGVCCVVALSCGDKSFENNTFFANPDFPEPSWEARLCEVELKKKHTKVLQIMIEFEEFELAPPNHEGECITDVFQVKLASNRPSPYSLLRICGQNTGQHLYLDVSQIDEPLVLSVATSGGGFPRRWSIRIVQMDEKNFLLAPPGCLQYYTDTVGHFRSFNLGKNLKNLYYAICFRIDNGYSGIRFTENFFGMNGPFCRKRIGGPNRHNGSHIVAHPHHLVIPPPGYATPLPRPIPKYLPQPIEQPYPGQATLPPQQTPVLTRYKRFAYSEPEGALRATRTLPSEHEKEFKHGHGSEHFPQHSPHHGGFENHGPEFGPPAAPPAYGVHPYGQQAHGGHQYGGEQYYKQHEKPEFKEKFAHEGEAKGWGWKNSFGWVGAGNKEEGKFEKYGQQGHQHGHYQMGYGPQPYGHQGGYGGYGPQQGYKDYHHKEIDKFGKQYEHLEYKHEKNHLGKEKDNKSSWWPSWGSKKEDKKLEKFQQHHEALFPMMHIPEMPHCEPRFCGQNDVITFPPSGDSISEMCGNRFNRGRGPKIISGSPLVVYVSNRGHGRGAGFDMNYEQVFYIPKPY